VVLGIQLVPVDRSNPPVTGQIEADPAVMAVLRTSCFDCHSNETKWPWYSAVAPVSWLVAYDVEEGREHLNFSTWASLSPEKQRAVISECREEVEEGEMPIDIYVSLHAEAALSAEAKLVLRQWAQANGSGEDEDHHEDEPNHGDD
jgi:hypothetical protein